MGAMTSPPQDNERQVPAYVALVRIAAVIGMSTALAFGLFILLLGPRYFLVGFGCIALALPFFFVMRLVERRVEVSQPPPPPE